MHICWLSATVLVDNSFNKVLGNVLASSIIILRP